jgi:hypothetical protein
MNQTAFSLERSFNLGYLKATILALIDIYCTYHPCLSAGLPKQIRACKRRDPLDNEFTSRMLKRCGLRAQ